MAAECSRGHVDKKSEKGQAKRRVASELSPTREKTIDPVAHYFFLCLGFDFSFS